MIPWYVFALISAISFAGLEILGKRALIKLHAMEYRTSLSLMQLPFMLLLIPMIGSIPEVWQLLFMFLIAAAVVVGAVFWSKAIKYEEISSISPLLNLSPLFLVIFAFFLLGEKVTLQQGIGIGILLTGAYILQVDHSTLSIKDPIMKLFKGKVMHFVLITLVLYSLAAIGDKYIIGMLDIFTYLFWIWLFVLLLNLAIQFILYEGIKDIKNSIKVAGPTLFVAGMLGFISMLAQFQALTMAMVTLVIPIKRLSTLFATLIGGELFHEHSLGIKSVACVILIIGATLILM